MIWIRGPFWDSVWILSAPVLGLLMLVPWYIHGLPTVKLTMALLAISDGHTVSPIALAWSHPEYRQIMLQQPRKFILVPGLVMIVAGSIAFMTWWLFPYFRPVRMVLENVRLDNLIVPLVLWANLYAVWNLYHAGAQNFGLWCLYRRRSVPKPAKWWVLGGFIAVTIFLGHGLSQLVGSPIAFLFLTGLTTVNHWTAAIGLAAHVHGRRYGRSPAWFAIGVIAVGGLLAWAFFSATAWSAQAAIMALALRGGLGVWHFLQDRWIWRMSDPQVRATIGKEVFADPHRRGADICGAVH